MGKLDRIQLDRRYYQALREATTGRRARGCFLLDELSFDEDGYVWINFSCLSHGDTWRELLAVIDDDGCLSALGNGDVNGVGRSDPAQATVTVVDLRDLATDDVSAGALGKHGDDDETP